jgi:hypothetical protein
VCALLVARCLIKHKLYLPRILYHLQLLLAIYFSICHHLKFILFHGIALQSIDILDHTELPRASKFKGNSLNGYPRNVISKETGLLIYVKRRTDEMDKMKER